MSNARDVSTMDGPMLFGRSLDGKGGGEEVSWAKAQPILADPNGPMIWVHLCRSDPSVEPWLRSLDISEPTAELLVSDQTRPRAFREGDSIVATLRGINFNPGAQPEDMVSMQLWCDGRRLITLRRQPLQTPRDVLAMIDRRVGPADVSAVITELAELMINRMTQSIVDMNDTIDDLEQLDADDHAEFILSKISVIRRNCLGLKRHMSPQHVALEAIRREAPDWFEGHDRREISETIERLRRYLDDIDISKESAIVLQDELRARSLASSEHATYMLTIVAGVFLPLSFLTGLLGINVGGIPGVDQPDAFWVVVVVCLLVFVGLIALFRRLRWL